MFAALPVEGQTRRPRTQRPKAAPPAAPPAVAKDDISEKPPFLVTARVYQARFRASGIKDVTGQVFRLRTANLVDEEKWLTAFQKVYPGFDLALLQSGPMQVYRSSRATRLLIGSAGGRALESLLSGAFSYGDGKTPGTALVVETNLNFGRPAALSLDIQTIEVEDGMTYFFTLPRLRINADEYVTFIRPGAPHKPFEADVFMIVLAFSIELTPAPAGGRVLDETQSKEVSAEATRRVEPEVSMELKQQGLSGVVRTRIEITPDGRVSHAHVISSTFPEMNAAALAAVRQWEFSPKLFDADKRPISAVVRFDFAPPKK